jgi:hypothetical protein
VPQAEVEIIAVEFDTPIVVDRDDSNLRPRLVRLLGMYPVHLVARMVRHARPGGSANVAVRHNFSSGRGSLHEEPLLPVTGQPRPLRHPSHP